MERAEEILSAVQCLYDGLLTPAGVVDALPSLCDAMRSTMSMCAITKSAIGTVPPIISVGYDPKGIQLFRDFIAKAKTVVLNLDNAETAALLAGL